MRATFAIVVCAVTICTSAAPAPAAGPAPSEYYLKTVLVDGAANPAALGRVSFKNADPTPKNVNDPLPAGTVIGTPAHVAVIVARRDNVATITVNPESSLTLVATTDRGGVATLGSGSLQVEVVPHVLDFFRVNFRRFTAAVRGTAFSVDARDAKSVAFSCTRGSVDVVETGSIYLTGQYRSVHGVQAVSELSETARRTVSYNLDERQYLQRFGTLKDASTYFRGQLAAAEASGDPVRVDAALASLFALYRNLGDRPASDETARRRVTFATSHRAVLGDRSLAEAYAQLAKSYSTKIQDDLDNARRSMTLWGSVDPEGSQPSHAAAMRAFGDALSNVGRPEEALAAYQGAIAIAKTAHDDLQLSLTTEQIGVLDSTLHDREGQLAQYQSALQYALLAYPSGVWPEIAQLNRDLSFAAEAANDVPAEISYAKVALDQWRALIGDETNTRVLQNVDRYVTTLTNWSRFDDALAVVNKQIGTLRAAGRMRTAQAATLLEDRAVVFEDLRRSKDARADRAEAKMIRARLPREVVTDPEDRLFNRAVAAWAAKSPDALRFATMRLQSIMRQPDVSPLRVADAYEWVSDYAEHANDIPGAVADRRHQVDEIRKIGPIARRRLADAYTDLAYLEYRHNSDAAAVLDAREALRIASEPPVLVVQSANARRAEAWAEHDRNRHHEEADALVQVVALDRRQQPIDPVQLAQDEDNLGNAIFLDKVEGDNAKRIEHYEAARKALVDGNVPPQSDIWDANENALGVAYFTKGDHQLALEYSARAFDSLARRRPLMNDVNLAYYARRAATALEELAHHDDKKRISYLDKARSYGLKAIRILSNLGASVNPFDRYDAYHDLEEIDMMRADRGEITSAIGNALTQLDLIAHMKTNRFEFSYRNLVDSYMSLAEDEQITAHTYLKQGIRSDALLAWFILDRGRPALALPHDLDAVDAKYHYYLAIVLSDLGAARAADHERAAARRIVKKLPDELQQQLLRNLKSSSDHTDAWKDRPLRRSWLLAEIEVNRENAKQQASAADARGRLVDDYIALSDLDIYLERPRDAIVDANAGLAIDPGNVKLILNLAHGYLYSGDVASAKAIYLAHRNDPYPGGKAFADAVLADFKAYSDAGIDVAATAEIRAALAAP